MCAERPRESRFEKFKSFKVECEKDSRCYRDGFFFCPSICPEWLFISLGGPALVMPCNLTLHLVAGVVAGPTDSPGRMAKSYAALESASGTDLCCAASGGHSSSSSSSFGLRWPRSVFTVLHTPRYAT